VTNRGDAHLGRAARSALAKVTAVLPHNLRAILDDPVSGVAPLWGRKAAEVDVAAVRKAIRSRRKLFIHYEDEKGRSTERTVWPLLIGYLDSALALIAWCELRNDFRSFRLDRIGGVEFLSASIPRDPSALRRQWRSSVGVGSPHPAN
jgi:predicted DNA-binding transcriptional regulator YafY